MRYIEMSQLHWSSLDDSDEWKVCWEAKAGADHKEYARFAWVEKGTKSRVKELIVHTDERT